jgi:hypothetical protein
MVTDGDRKLNRLVVVESQLDDASSEPIGHCRNTALPPVSTTEDSPPQRSNPVLPKTTQASR